MKLLKKLIPLLTLALFTFSCDDDTPTEASIGITCTGVLNDANDNGLADKDETITYTFNIQNTGDIRLQNIEITDDRLSIYNVVVQQFVVSPGDTVSKTIDYTLTDNDIYDGNITNQTTVTAKTTDGQTVTDLSDMFSYTEDHQTIISFTPFLGDYEHGYFITNEGPYGSGTGTLTFINDNGSVTQNVYNTVNGEDLGNIVQSMSFYQNKGYIVVNNSHKVIVVNRYTMEKLAVIEGSSINNPRYFVAEGNTAYVSNWGDPSSPSDDFIAVIDLTTNNVSSTISVGEGPEDMLISDGKIYVNLQGGYSQNNKVEIIDMTSNTVSSTLTVGDVPNAIVKDDNNAIWVLCGGKPSWTGSETNGSLVKITNETIAATLDFDATKHPNLLTLNGSDLIYHLDGKVYATSNSATAVSATALANLDGFYYAMKAHDGKLYTTNAGDFSSEGTLKVFDLSTNTEISSTTVGIIPGSIIFQ